MKKTINQFYARSALYLLSAISLISCGGGSSDPASGGSTGNNEELTVSPIPDLTGTFQYLGYIHLTDDSVEDRINRDANFFEFVSLQNASALGSSVPMVEDSCSARVLNTIPTNSGTIGFPEVPFHLISAGDRFTLTNTDDDIEYAAVLFTDSRFDIAPYPMPDNLTLDLTGGTFPGFSSLTVPTIPVISNFNPTRNQDVTVDTVFTWDQIDINTGSIYMRLINFASPTVEPLSPTKYVEIYCRMANDGSFELPQAVKDILIQGLGNGFTLTGAERDEKATDVIVNGDAALVVIRSIDRL